MKILHVTPDWNFWEKFVRPIAQYQLESGLDVEAISSKGISATSDQNQSKTNDTLEIDVHNFSLKPRMSGWLSSLLKFVKILRDTKPDVVVVHTTTLSMVPLLLMRIFYPRVMRIYFNHGVPYIGHQGIIGFVLKVVEKANLWLSHSVYTVSKSMQQIMQNLASGKEIELVGVGSACGVPLEYESFNELELERKRSRSSFDLAEDEIVLLYVGRPVGRKGIWDLISAWEDIRPNFAVKLYLVGVSKHDLEVQNITCKPGMEVFGYVPDPSRHFLAADILCVPSHHEGLGYTYIEAAQFGCVPVCSDIPGPTDFVRHQETGVVVEPGNIASIVTQLNDLCKSPEKRSRIAEQAFLESLLYERQPIVKAISNSMSEKLRRHFASLGL